MLSRARFLRGGAAVLGAMALGRPAEADIGLAYPATDYRAQPGGKPGGTLKISVSRDTATLDPHALSDTNVEWIGRMLFDNLVYLDEHGNITPWLAQSWTISPDGTVYTFQLRNDVTFSDGARFNAEAVLLNLEHMRNPETKSPLAATYIQPYATGRVVDEFTFEATLHEPYSPFLNVLAQAWLAMESPEVIRKDPASLLYHPVGSGPFVLESYMPTQGMRLFRRADYHWGPPLIGHQGPAYLDRLEFEFVPDASVRYFSLVSGEYDFTTDVPPQAAAAIRRDAAVTLTDRVRMGVPNRPILFNVEKPPFDDVRVRRAAALALNRDGIAAVGGFGVFRPIANFLAENTPYYDPRFAAALAYDPRQAAGLLDEAGWTGRDADGIRTRGGERLAASILAASSILALPVVVQMQADLKAVGFDLTIDEMPQTSLVLLRNSGNYQAMSGGVWHTNTPDALYINYHGSQIPCSVRAGQNASRLNDPALNALLEAARRTLDHQVLQALYSQAQARLVELVPAVPVYDNQSVIAFNNKVRGVVYDTSHETPHFETIWLEDAA